MNKRTKRVTLREFKWLLARAQKNHLTRHEPIPQLSRQHLDQVDKCLRSPFQTFFLMDLYPGFIPKAAILFYLLIKDHPIINGNKRMAILVLAYFFKKNRQPFALNSEDLYRMAKRTEASRDKDDCLRYLERKLSPQR